MRYGMGVCEEVREIGARCVNSGLQVTGIGEQRNQYSTMTTR